MEPAEEPKVTEPDAAHRAARAAAARRTRSMSLALNIISTLVVTAESLSRQHGAPPRVQYGLRCGVALIEGGLPGAARFVSASAVETLVTREAYVPTAEPNVVNIMRALLHPPTTWGA